MRRRVLIDLAGIRMLERIDQRPVEREMRYYYVPLDPRALLVVVSRCGVLEDLAGRVCEAAIGWSAGWHGKCRSEHEGLQLSKLTLERIRKDKAFDQTLSAFIEESKKLPRKRPPKGAPWARPYGFDEEKE